jgi:hypothetical protein
VIAKRFAARKRAVFLRLDNDRDNLQQCIRLRIETARFHIDDDGQETAKAVGNGKWFAQGYLAGRADQAL